MDVIGMPRKEACRILESAGYTVIVEEIFSDKQVCFDEELVIQAKYEEETVRLFVSRFLTKADERRT